MAFGCSIGTAGPSWAQSVDARKAPPQQPYWVDFKAGRVELDGGMQHLELAEDVEVIVDRYRLTSDHLELTRGPRGVEVEGEGRVALCRCDDAPVTLGFESATVAPPTDLLIESPTVRVGDVPVLWLPYLWLRSPDRAGLLPPRIAWRGRDGMLLGAGAHLPLGKAPRARTTYADLMLSGYTAGGAEAVATVGSPQSATSVRWDHVRSSSIDIDASGSTSSAASTGAWRVTAVRGARGRSGNPDLHVVSMRYDRADLGVERRGAAGIVGIGMRGVARRAGALDDVGWLGPKLDLGVSGTIDGYGAADAALQTWTAAARESTTSTYALHASGVRVDARPGPTAVALFARERVLALSTAEVSGVGLAAGAGSELSLPLVRNFGTSSAPLWHWLSPFATIEGAATSSKGGVEVPLPAEGRWLAALTGVRTALENHGRRTAWDLRVSGGWIGHPNEPNPALAGAMVSSGEDVSASLSLAALPDRRAVLTSSRASFRLPESVLLSASIEGRRGEAAASARWMDQDVWDAPWADWYSVPGWSAGTRVVVPWTHWLASSVWLDYDVSAERWLGQGSNLAYRHPCGCLAVVGDVHRRLGRQGIDASLSLDLVP